MLAHGVVKWAIRFVIASTTTTTADVDVDAEVMQRGELGDQRLGMRDHPRDLVRHLLPVYR